MSNMIYYKIRIPVDEIAPPLKLVSFAAPYFGAAHFENADEWFLKRRLKAYFMKHYEDEFKRLYSEQWVRDERIVPIRIPEHFEVVADEDKDQT